MLLAPRELAFHVTSFSPLGPGEVRLRSLLSGISHGTELNLYRGTSALADQVFDRALRSMVPAGEQTPYPATLSYGLVSAVEEVGPAVDGLRRGDIVHTATPHCDEVVLNVEQARNTGFPLVRLRLGASLAYALFISVATVALQGVQDAQIKLGDHVAFVGLGAIGLLTVRMARRSGAASVHVVDPVTEPGAQGARVLQRLSRREPPNAVALPGADEAKGVHRPVQRTQPPSRSGRTCGSDRSGVPL
jgi:threonine dehydrogenase-like Zn-dependent dehydrogenase